MKLNRNNYEEYFILYTDNELSSDERREVEMFLQENPDLKAEMNILLQSKLTPDTDIYFSDKGSLMRFGSASVNLENYEEWLLSYIDDELDNDEKAEVEKFVAANPVIQKELTLLQRAKLQPEAITFPNKESLYRKEEKAKVIVITWRRIAVAAVLLIAVSTTGIVLLKNNKQGGGQGPFTSANNKKDSTTPAPKENIAKNNDKTSPVNTTDNKDGKKEQLADISPASKKNESIMTIGKTPAIDKKEDKVSVDTKSQQPEQVKQDDKLLANNDNIEQKPSNNLARPEQNPNVTGNSGDIKPNDKLDTQSPELTEPNKKTDVGAVTVAQLNPSDLREQSSKNKGVRGFFRKLTRTFEKRTNIKATDDDDRLLIAGLAIKLN